MTDLKNVLPEDAVFNALIDVRVEIKRLLMDDSDIISYTPDRISAIYNNNMVVYRALDILDSFIREVTP